LTTENVTVLFTDLVGSTALQSSVAPDVADELRRGHFTVLRQAIAETGGTEVKNLGDGLMVVFGSASSALSCAVAMQQGVELDGRGREVALGIRVGMSAGEVTREGDDYFGDPVIEAARLCARCDGGQVLATDLVRLNAGRRNPHASNPLGPLELKGLPDPVEVVELIWEPQERQSTEHSSLPGLLTESGRFPFAGRQKEAEALLGAYSSVATGATRLVLVAGEPGIGKTRLTSELAQQVLDAGALVLAGRSDELVGVPYQPFMDALRWQMAQPGGVEDLGPRAGELVRLVPELFSILPDLAPPIVSSPEAERLALFEAVREWLGALSAHQPVLLVLDDLHWADMGTLLLLRHVIANDPVPGLLVVATYRDTDLDRTHPLSNVLAEFHRRGDVERIVLSGLEEAEVTELMEKTAGHELDEVAINLAMTVQVDTGGNPFFVGEVLRHLAESGAITQEDGRWVAARDGDPYLPEGIRQVVGRRLSVLPEETQKLLSSASVIGTRFDLDLWPPPRGWSPTTCSTPSSRPSTPTWSWRSASAVTSSPTHWSARPSTASSRPLGGDVSTWPLPRP
jgi:class 3 adenylate cyclase